MDFLKFFVFFFALLVCAAAVSLPAVETPAKTAGTSPKKSPFRKLQRPKRQFGPSFASASANAGSFGGGFGPYGFYPGGGSSFASANANAFGRK